ncbi:YbaB/EbfC family nucleoid-associated protein [Methylobacter sp. BlB1]|uniref:YbaB/EbfC family nucleoid-associated protein n=1 Tax=Methylobacter sp. BlB1 TaxID=2785914 RepID=UPI0018952712|nr:YbaB/EbfC family nucleoid-associated protein [Methylobacter sp. BlB1]MBF6650442.1 YbaB/EbfC family nucleoid-associated protein [Methylobacter sp. BlB1]
MLKSNKKKKPNPQKLGQIYKRQLDQAKQEFEQLEFPCESERGEVKVVLTGRRQIKTLVLAPEIMQGEKDRAEGLIIAVVNQALTTVRDANVQLTDAVAKKFNAQYG